jgi:Domain of unknown function (DUF4304)
MPLRSESSRLVDAAIAAGPAPLLKAAGYRKLARSFHAHAAPFTTVVHFQASMWNSPASARFTVNLNIVLPFFHEKWTGQPFPKNPASAAPVASQRIGQLMPEKLDHWWEVASGYGIDGIASQLSSALSDFGLPFLDRYSNLDLLVQEVQDKSATYRVGNPDLCLAILLSYRGEVSKAVRVLEALQQRTSHEGFAATIRTIAHRLGMRILA